MKGHSVKHSEQPPSPKTYTYAKAGGLIVGLIGFLIGFIGPMLFAPKDNQGPLAGFITAPIGVLLGTVFGVVLDRVSKSRAKISHEARIMAIQNE